MARFSYSRKQGFLSGTENKKKGNNDFSSDHVQELTIMLRVWHVYRQVIKYSCYKYFCKIKILFKTINTSNTYSLVYD